MQRAGKHWQQRATDNKLAMLQETNNDLCPENLSLLLPNPVGNIAAYNLRKCQEYSNNSRKYTHLSQFLPSISNLCGLTRHKMSVARAAYYPHLNSNQGPVVQSVVSLTSSLRVISLTVLADSIYNILIFFAEKMWVVFALQKLLTFFQQKISVYLRITRCKF